MSEETCRHCGHKVETQPDLHGDVRFVDHFSRDDAAAVRAGLTFTPSRPCEGFGEVAPTDEDRRDDEADRKIKDAKENP